MSASTLGAALRQIQTLIDDGPIAGLGDGALLARFADEGDATAFAALVDRHGSMVLATARAALGDAGDADDAFQATFLILARRAGSIRDAEALGGWLHRVAQRSAAKARAAAAARRRHEREAGGPRARPGPVRDRLDDPSAALHEEIDRLPDRYRLPVVLCHLEGLTHAEAARRLRRGERTLRRHLAEALPRLRHGLIRRGIGLSTSALVASLARSAKAAVPQALATLAARAAASGEASGAVAHLAGRVLLGSALGKLKLASAVALGMIASAALAGSAFGRAGRDDAMTTKPAGKPGVAAVPSKADPKPPAKVWTYAGRVVDPEGKPFAGAKLLLDYSPDWEHPTYPVRATSGPDGGFRFTLDASAFQPDGGMEKWVRVAAKAPGFGLGLSDGAEDDNDRELTVRLAPDDAPIEGRLVDLEGRPVVGASVRIKTFWAPMVGDLSPFIANTKAGGEYGSAYNSPYNHLARADFAGEVGLIPTAVTGPDGRYRLAGIGRDRIVALRFEGPNVRTTELLAITRRLPKFKAPEDPNPSGRYQETYHGSTVDLVMPPSRPIVGVIRDRDSGRPLPGATVVDMMLADAGNHVNTMLTRATSDAEGRYRLVGLPKGPGNKILIYSPKDEPYLPSYKTIEEGPGLAPLELDLPLKRGVWATGKVVDRATGKPISNAAIAYHAAADNPHLAEAPGFREAEAGFVQYLSGNTDEDGSYRLAVLPGRGMLSLRVADDRYPSNYADPKANGPNPGFVPTYHGLDHAHAAIEVPEGGGGITRDFSLEPARTLRGTTHDAEGRPLTGVSVYGRGRIGGWDGQSEGSTFTVDALTPATAKGSKPDEPFTLLFRHDEKRLAAWRDVRGDEPGPIVVRLEPWAEATGRVVDATGKPRPRVAISAYAKDKRRRGNGLVEHRSVPTLTGDDGRFRLDGLAPGLAFRINVQAADNARWLDLAPAAPGRTTDLGDISIGGEAQ